MKRVISIAIVIFCIGSLYIYAQAAEYYYGKEANIVPTVSGSAILEKDVLIWKDDFVEEAANISQEKSMTEETVVELSDENLEQMKSEADSFLSSSVASDFLSMDAESFENKYDRNQLYGEALLYCDMNAWQYHGTQLDAYSNAEDYYDVANIAALRYIVDDRLYDFVEENHADAASYDNSSSVTSVYIQYMGDYAISIYFQKDMDTNKDSVKLLEISFIKVELEKEVAPESLYQYLEGDYYEVREAILLEDWILSPEGNKEVCVRNGMLPKHPAQIFVRYRGKTPDAVFRFEWEQGIVGWIDEEHIICYMINWTPHLLHLETNQIEELEIDVDDLGLYVYDPCVAQYEINGNQLIAEDLGEEVYRWNIVKGNHEVYIRKENRIYVSDRTNA